MDIGALTEDAEAVSAHYANRHATTRTDGWFVLRLNDEVGELTQAYLAHNVQTRDMGRSGQQLRTDLGQEVADVLVQTLLIAKQLDVDAARAVDEEWMIWQPGREETTSSPTGSPRGSRSIKRSG